jgi:transmembrane sensor
MEKLPGYYQSQLSRYLRNELPAEQVEELLQWIGEEPEAFTRYLDNDELRMLLVDSANAQRLDAAVSARMKNKLLQELQTEEITAALSTPRSIPLYKRSWLKYAAAAIIILGIGAYLWNIQTHKEKTTLSQVNPHPVKNDVLPGGNRAILTLSDGKQIVLDTAANGAIAKDGGAEITKSENGQIKYLSPLTSRLSPAGSDLPSPVVLYNTMTTPRGGQFELTLPDGSRVWLNAESSIRYPTAFTGNKREVSITGEAYFEVTKDAKKPFRVVVSGGILSLPGQREGSPDGLEIEVLGTHFNVNAYKDEPKKNITLLEGSVRLTSHFSPLTSVHTSVTLKPGQQGQYDTRSEALTRADKADVEQAVAWKNGYFNFEQSDLKTILRQFARWYDITVVYEGNLSNEKFFGIISRNTPLSAVLRSLQANNIQFRIEGKTLYVK